MKLWNVHIEHRLVVLAETEAEAEHIGRAVVHDEDCAADFAAADEIKERQHLSASWWDSLPWSAPCEDNERTCVQWLMLFEAQERQAKIDAEFAARQLPLSGTETP